ncbi:type II secretion system F family protein [Parasedimentitalea huanghaiensis]|uniref:Type II secretion system protein GspF domain-containing protein n=1 Tax=Parasedimentitalea huanghaiensis TaxID=2682100 RepID=A0A6L6WP76_9RHOB|nr:type II secretion system F family protein [Zongyanglinia huanghaiensis]MVO18475.1 hypothetical protein [Zongyanglinia huanghaiensis]
MAEFYYTGYDANGQTERGSITSASEQLAFELLQSRGITVFDLREDESTTTNDLPWYRKDIKFGHQELALEEQAATADLLATLFSSQLPVSEVFRIAALSTENPKVKSQFERIRQLVDDGTSLARAFETENRLFSPVFISFLGVSDKANALPLLLRSLSSFFLKLNETRQKIISALIYPAILMIAACGLLLVVVLYLAPNLEPLFRAADRKPPDTLSALLQINIIVSSYWHWMLLGLVGSFLLLGVSLQQQRSRIIFYDLALRVPLIGKLLRFSALARLTQATELLLTSGQPLPLALRQAVESMGASAGFGQLFKRAATTLEAGGTASSVISEHRLVPANYKELFRIGEETNRLPTTLVALSETLNAQVDRHAQRLLSMLTPMLTLVLGLGIGYLIFTLMGAILEINEIAF